MKYYDYHTHTPMSDGDLTVGELLQAAGARGFGLGISDHLFCCKLLTPRDVAHYLDELERFDVLRGVEANLGENFTLPASLDKRVDYVIASVHSVQDLNGGRLPLDPYFCARAGDEGALPYTRVFTSDEAKRYLEQILEIISYDFANQRVDIFGHCTVNPFYETLRGGDYLAGWEDEVIALCLRHKVAIELSGLWQCPDEAMVQKALARGAHFSMGSDCHIPAHAANLDYPLELVRRLKIPDEQIFTVTK